MTLVDARRPEVSLDHAPGARRLRHPIFIDEAGPEGLELVAFGPHRRGDGEILQDRCSD